MYMVVIFTAIGIYLILLALRYAFKVKLTYGVAGLLLILMPYSIGILKTLDSGTCIVMLILAVGGVFILVSDIARHVKKV